MTRRSDRHAQDSQAEVAPSRRRGRHRIRAAAVCSGVALMSVLAAGCGGGSSPGVASLGSTTTTTTPAAVIAPKGTSGSPSQELQYVKCLQTHGEPNFPDPGPNALAEMKAIDLNSAK